MSKYFILNSATCLFSLLLPRQMRPSSLTDHIRLSGAVFSHLALEISEGARAEPPLQTAPRMSHHSKGSWLSEPQPPLQCAGLSAPRTSQASSFFFLFLMRFYSLSSFLSPTSCPAELFKVLAIKGGREGILFPAPWQS